MNRFFIKKTAFTGILFLFSIMLWSQNETPDLITDRPDQTESSVLVPHQSLQIESGFILENNETSLAKQKSFAYNTTLLRFGLLENLELRAGLEYLGEKEEFKNSDSTATIAGISPLYAGFKVKIADEEGWKPEIAVLGGLIVGFTANKEFRPEYTAADFRLAFSHTLSDQLSLGYNLGAEWDGETAIPQYFYSLSIGAGITENLGMFLESYGWLPEEGDASHLLDAGLTYLILPNFQFDVSAGIGLQNSIDNFISIGLTYRIPE